jgi:hypothetical protein
MARGKIFVLVYIQIHVIKWSVGRYLGHTIDPWWFEAEQRCPKKICVKEFIGCRYSTDITASYGAQPTFMVSDMLKILISNLLYQPPND